jgi:DNA segregation ATPase FtsK/SpoIIIE, S-DNA-T family
MSTDPAGDGHNAEVVPLRARQAEPAEIERGESGPAVYADVTPPGERKPILPPWLRGRDAMRHHARRAGGYAWHSARFHAVRSPLYLVLTAWWAGAGIVSLAVRWLRWLLFPVPLEVYTDAVADGHRAWHRAHQVHEKATKDRAIISVCVAAAAVLAAVTLRHRLPWWVWFAPAGAVVVLLARYGRGTRRIVQPAHVPAAYEALTETVISRAMGGLGIAGINQWLKEHGTVSIPEPIRQDGPGWRAVIDLPFGVTATMVIERRGQLASGLRRPLGAVWPEPDPGEHEGRLHLYVGREDISKAKAPPWPLLRSGSVDVFKPFPWAVSPQGRKVNAAMVFHNWLIGSIPRQGKTAAVRVLACGIALDPLAELWIHENKGTGDLDDLAQVSHRFVSGIDDDSIAYAAESLALLRREAERRAPRIKALDPRLCPEKKVTREIAGRRSLKLWPLAAIFDEVQNVFSHPVHGKQAAADAEWLIKIAPAMGIFLILATQRPDADSLPKGISANVDTRFCLKVMTHVENDMILGGSAHKAGIRATMFRQGVDLGVGYYIGEEPPQVCRSYYLDTNAAKVAVARARAARERAGTITGYAAGQDTSGPARDVLADALACFAGEGGLWWAELAGRLAQRWPDRYEGLTADAISAQLRDAKVPTVTVSMGGQKAKGARKTDIEAAAAAAVTPRSAG